MNRIPGAAVLAAALCVTLALSACATRVERIGVDETRDLSGEWNDTDSRLVSEEMVRDVLDRPWLDNFINEKGNLPAVVVGEVRNLSHEHINVATFIGDIERELLNSGGVQFVASKSERGQIRDERKDQELNASAETAKRMGEELGADFMLQGAINSILDTEGKEQVRYYQVDLSLVSLADNRKVWAGQKKIKKFVKKNSIRW